MDLEMLLFSNLTQIQETIVSKLFLCIFNISISLLNSVFLRHLTQLSRAAHPYFCLCLLEAALFT